ncbi:ethylbenzene dehydrogenase-related protein [Geoalkalibacter subterraneus]|uniref:Cytochrome c-552/DMSO reductase-like haem-binding domain-containing protein n=1 Tax=Geoalkalibacter subterraneus TaxID=483547 RepID=A0A0B5FQ52_9BACT|nr:ethylbenzene dehydrogenase-related protein [Geoalkalibacter subterraneus]AJF05726.1 hypothetical protein GSUB_02875 [Geoalkalibacter subterraneus]
MNLHRVILTFFSALTLISSCREIPADRLYALKLEKPPSETDWQRTLPRTVTVRGGRPHKENPLPDINEDTVHTSTPSCHHGGQLPDPIRVEMKAFYTETDLYLRLVWRDPTADTALNPWIFDGEKWNNEPRLQDGLGLIWADPAQFSDFTCARSCHIDDFGVSGSGFHAGHRMKLASPDKVLDLWSWQADLTARLGFADDRRIDEEGMHGDLPGEIFSRNSRMASLQNSTDAPFGEQDRPLVDADGRPPGGRFYAPGTLAPGYLVSPPHGSRADVSAHSRHENGRWVLTLRRNRISVDPLDRSFLPGEGNATHFGLAVMDHTLSEHYASTLRETLVLLE